MGVGIVIFISIIILIAVIGSTESIFLGICAALVPWILYFVFVGWLVHDDSEKYDQKNIQKGNEIIKKDNKFDDILNSAPQSYNIVTVRDTTLNLYLGKFKIWKNGNKITLLAYRDTELSKAIGQEKIKSVRQLRYSFDADRISLFERENNEQYVTHTSGGGSKLSIWTGNEKVGRIYTTEHKVGDKRTLLFIENNPKDIKIMFDYDDYSVLNRIINNC